jgi:hypothetical protein
MTLYEITHSVPLRSNHSIHSIRLQQMESFNHISQFSHFNLFTSDETSQLVQIRWRHSISSHQMKPLDHFTSGDIIRSVHIGWFGQKRFDDLNTFGAVEQLLCLQCDDQRHPILAQHSSPRRSVHICYSSVHFAPTIINDRSSDLRDGFSWWGRSPGSARCSPFRESSCLSSLSSLSQ